VDPITDAPELAVVLGGGLDADGTPLPSTRARAHRGAQLARERPELGLICSGDRQPGAPEDAPSEAAQLRDLITGFGIAADRIVLEDESRDTLANAVLTAARYLHDLEPRPLSVITSPFHLERATETFRHVLGYRWQVMAVASDETDDDVARAARETRYLQETTAFFTGIKPGDLRAIAVRFRDRSPEYATTAVLRRLLPS
jgi:uncharacterized SAM-binding protein YcdF (DUF218 family)